jgi:hypothetical protein
MNYLEKRSREIIAAAEDKIRPIEFIRTQVREMSTDDVIDLAVAYLYGQVKQRRRAHVREIEQSAQRAQTSERAGAIDPEPRWGTAAWERWASLPQNHETAERTRERRAEIARRDAEAYSELTRNLNAAMEKFKSELRMQWTAELLAAEFALGDGTVTTWGEATREQHEARMAMHKRNALSGMEGYARHAAALEEMDRTGTTCLRDALQATDREAVAS